MAEEHSSVDLSQLFCRSAAPPDAQAPGFVEINPCGTRAPHSAETQQDTGQLWQKGTTSASPEELLLHTGWEELWWLGKSPALAVHPPPRSALLLHSTSENLPGVLFVNT